MSTPTSDLTTSKLLFNSAIYTLNIRFMCMDIKDFYLATPMEKAKYMQAPIRMIPDEVMEEYQLHNLFSMVAS